MLRDEASSQEFLLDDHSGASWRGEEWMRDTWEHIKHLPITQVVLPGSHNAATSELTGDVAQDHGGNTIRTLHGYLGKNIGDVFARGWSVTQPHCVKEQLGLGVRYLDLRVCVDSQLELPAALRTCHGYFGPALRSVLDDAKVFVAAHSHEFLLLDFNHLYNMTPAAHAALVQLLRDTFGSLLIEDTDLCLPLQDLHDRQRRVLVAYHANISSRPRWLLQGHAVQSPWPNVPEASRLEERLADILHQRRGGESEEGRAETPHAD